MPAAAHPVRTRRQAGSSLLSAPSISVGGNVTCLGVTENHAVVGADNSGGSLPVGGVLFEILDGPTESLGFTLVDAPPTTCPATLGIDLVPLTSNDITVTDAQPFPTSKNQCKNGNWRNFGSTFKNEGKCVSFVATGGKKQP